jgi:hypothetical protein
VLIPASTSITISRVTQLDAYSDPVDINSDPIAVGVPAALASTSVRQQNPASGTPRQVTVFTCVVPNGTDVQTQDRITDQADGSVYNVDVVNGGTNYGFIADIVLTLSAVGG